MSKKQLYIHIGTHKTGTTAIQKFLSANSDYLLTQGVLYPNFCREDDKHNHLIYHYSKDLNEVVKRNFDEKEVIALKKAFDDEVEKSGARKIILSSEDLFLPLEKQAWQFIRALCQGYEAFMVVYFRRQDEFIISCHNQMVKYSSFLKQSLLQLIEQDKDFLQNSLDRYKNVLSAWSDIVGDDHIIVVPYENEVKHDAVAHFLKCVDIQDSPQMSKPESRENISIPYTLIKLKVLMNSANQEDTSPRYLSDFMELVKLLNRLRLNEDRQVSDPSPLSAQKRREIIAQYDEVNRRIAQKYLGKEALFEAPLPSDDEPFDEAATLSKEEWEEVMIVMFTDYMKSRRNFLEMQNKLHQELYNGLRQELYNELYIEFNNKFNNKYSIITWLHIFNVRIVLSFFRRKLLSAMAKLKRRTLPL